MCCSAVIRSFSRWVMDPQPAPVLPLGWRRGLGSARLGYSISRIHSDVKNHSPTPPGAALRACPALPPHHTPGRVARCRTGLLMLGQPYFNPLQMNITSCNTLPVSKAVSILRSEEHTS